jgi:predicted O-methyltransferase YrrM
MVEADRAIKLWRSLDEMGWEPGGNTEPWTINVLCAFARILKPLIVLESGVYRGYTTRALLTALRENTTYYAVDVNENYLDALPDDPRLHKWSGDILDFLQSDDVPSFDLAFLDDDHHEDHVREEVKRLRLLMEPGGLIFIHDVVGPFGLWRVVEENDGFILDLPILNVAGGLGVIQC